MTTEYFLDGEYYNRDDARIDNGTLKAGDDFKKIVQAALFMIRANATAQQSSRDLSDMPNVDAIAMGNQDTFTGNDLVFLSIELITLAAVVSNVITCSQGYANRPVSELLTVSPYEPFTQTSVCTLSDVISVYSAIKCLSHDIANKLSNPESDESELMINA